MCAAENCPSTSSGRTAFLATGSLKESCLRSGLPWQGQAALLGSRKGSALLLAQNPDARVDDRQHYVGRERSNYREDTHHEDDHTGGVHVLDLQGEEQYGPSVGRLSTTDTMMLPLTSDGSR